ncbi:MAG: ATP-binding cassette domain-containing protein [Planctomycetes bacterium]|nr:ATP-binding cassette domain-containing protein [Planctomycetota bacterium]
MTGPPLLVARSLSVGHDRDVVTGIDLELRAGESWFVLGANGSGKSTLVATLLGLLPPRAGEIRVADSVRRAVGYVPQEPRFEPSLPMLAAEFVAMGIDAGVRRRAAKERAAAALDAVGARDLLDRDVRALSTGQRRRVAIARALVRSPRLLVLDEPLANLDLRAASALAADLEQRRRAGLCVVHVAHEVGIARRLATHLALVADGRFRAGPAALLGREAFAEAEGPPP